MERLYDVATRAFDSARTAGPCRDRGRQTHPLEHAMSRKAGERGTIASLPAFPAGARREIYIPSQSILVDSEPPFERGKITQAAIDIFAVFFGIAFAGLVYLVIPFAFFLLFFVDLR